MRPWDVVFGRYGDAGAFVSWLTEEMERFNITQIDLTTRMGIHDTSVNRWILGHCEPSIRNMAMLDEALNEIIADRTQEEAL